MAVEGGIERGGDCLCVCVFFFHAKLGSAAAFDCDLTIQIVVFAAKPH